MPSLWIGLMDVLFRLFLYIILGLGIVYAFKRRKIKHLSVKDFPNISTEQFEKWRNFEMKSINIYLLSSWGFTTLYYIFKFILEIYLLPEKKALLNSDIPFMSKEEILFFSMAVPILYLISLIVGIVFSAIYGSKASKLKKAMFGARLK